MNWYRVNWIQPPSGSVPEEVRQAWIGLLVPVVRFVFVQGVHYAVIPFGAAMKSLRQASRVDAVAWWEQMYPYDSSSRGILLLARGLQQVEPSVHQVVRRPFLSHPMMRLEYRGMCTGFGAENVIVERGCG